MASWSILTPRAGRGAIAVVRLIGPDLVRAMQAIGLRPVEVGRAGLRDLLGVDHGVAARWDDRTLDLMPHGGPAVVRQLVDRLTAAGIEEPAEPAPIAVRCIDDVSDTAAAMIARAASPLAIDVLLRQAERWSASGLDPDPDPDPDSDRDRTADGAVLWRLIEPPLVAAIGPPNVGKSTLANALAGGAVSLVADAPGTTRDHVGLTLDLGGLVVRYLDLPGVREAPDDLERQAIVRALRAAASADLLLLCGDDEHPPIETAELTRLLGRSGAGPLLSPACGVLRVALRADLRAGFGAGLRSGPWRSDAEVSLPADGPRAGVDGLAMAIRSALLPDEALSDPRPWRFWVGQAGN